MSIRRRRLSSDTMQETAVLEPAVLVPAMRLRDALVETGGISAKAAAAAALERVDDRSVGSYFLDQGVITQDVLARAVARQHGLPFIDLTRNVPQQQAAILVPPQVAHDLRIIPLMQHEEGALDVVVADPADERVLAYLRSMPLPLVRIGMAPPSQFAAALNRTYNWQSDLHEIAASAASTVNAEAARDTLIDLTGDDAPIIQIVSRIVSQALRERVSDVHIEPTNERVRVRFRIDGALREVIRFLWISAGRW